jgi:hypothetical protein
MMEDLTEPDLVQGLQLLASFMQAIDDRDLETCAGLFADDPVLVINGTSYEGEVAIHGWLQGLAKQPKGKHINGNVVVVDAGPGAMRLRSDVAFFRQGSDGVWTVVATGRYLDDVVVRQNRCLLQRREIVFS